MSDMSRENGAKHSAGRRADRRVADDGQLPLDVGLNGELYNEEPMLDDEDSPAEAAQEPPLKPDPSFKHAAPFADNPFRSTPVAMLSSRQLVALAVVIILTLMIAVGGLWKGARLNERIDVLNEEIRGLQQRLAEQSRSDMEARSQKLGEDLERLAQRIDELGVIVEGPVGHLRESNERAFAALRERLDRLEKAQQQPLLVAPPMAAATNPTSQLDGKKAEVASAPSESRAGEQGWAINLFSLINARTADEELARLRKMGIRAEKQEVNQEGRRWYRLRVGGFDSYEGAKAYIDTIEKQTGITSAWVAKE